MLKFLPIVMLVLGTGAGVGAGYMFHAAPEPPRNAESTMQDADEGRPTPDQAARETKNETGSAPPEYIAFNNQFVVPIVRGDMVTSLVVLSLGIEITSGNAEKIYVTEPKLRDGFLQVLFDHANMGGFRGRFTDGNNMDVLRQSLTEAARSIIGPSVRGVMITDIARQDV